MIAAGPDGGDPRGDASGCGEEDPVSPRSVHRSVVVAAAFLMAVGMAGCGSSSSGGSGQGATSAGQSAGQAGPAKDATLAAMVPAAIAAKGTLVIGTDASYAPNEFIDSDGKTVIGFDADLAKAIGTVLGLKVDLRNAPFGTLVEGVKRGKFDLGMSSFTINADREAQVDMVSYYSAGTLWAVESGNPTGLTPDDACGKKIAVQKDTVQVPDITARSKKCTAAGKAPITIEEFPLQSDVTSAVVTGKDDGLLADSPVVAYAVKQTGGKLALVGSIYDAAPYGIAVPKGQGDYAKAVQGAVQKLMDSGTYLQILKKWNVQSGAVTAAQVNPKV
jgi:polar amino acid transport system substrate-binding protein